MKLYRNMQLLCVKLEFYSDNSQIPFFFLPYLQIFSFNI